MGRVGKMKRAGGVAGLAVLIALIFTGNSIALHTSLGFLFVSSTERARLWRFDLPLPPSLPPDPTLIASGVQSIEGIACGPDGKVWVAQSGFPDRPGARKIIRIGQGGSPVETVLDFSATSALVSSGGPEGPSFGLGLQDDGRLVPTGPLFFNTRKVTTKVMGATTVRPHTGVWKLDTVGGTPVNVITPFATAGDENGKATAVLNAGPFARHVLAADFPNNRIVHRDPTAPGAAIDFVTGVASPNGLAVDKAGNVYVAESSTGNIKKFASNGTSLGVFANTGTKTQRKIAFDGDPNATQDNLYVAKAAGEVIRITPVGTQTVIGDVTAANGVTVCPRRIPTLIDIKPGAFPNPINIGSQGVIPVAVLSTVFLNAPAAVNQATLKFGPLSALNAGGGASPQHCAPTDVNGDSLLDLICQFRTQDTGFQLGDAIGVLRWGNQDFEGLGSVDIGN